MSEVKKHKSITKDEQINYLSKLPLFALFSMWISLKVKPLRLKCKSLVNSIKKQDSQPNKQKYYLIIIKNNNCSFFA